MASKKRGIAARFILIVSVLAQGLMAVLAVVAIYTASHSQSKQADGFVSRLKSEQAEQENNKKAQRSFELANEVEQIHHKYFEAALKSLKEE